MARGAAPPPYSDEEALLVSRRIERARGSVYRVNGREVRARDVHLLLADAATGARSAALVTQGHVAAMIAAKPAERRGLLEEAAGIVGLHARRHEAELRLRSAEANSAAARRRAVDPRRAATAVEETGSPGLALPQRLLAHPLAGGDDPMAEVADG